MDRNTVLGIRKNNQIPKIQARKGEYIDRLGPKKNFMLAQTYLAYFKLPSKNQAHPYNSKL